MEITKILNKLKKQFNKKTGYKLSLHIGKPEDNQVVDILGIITDRDGKFEHLCGFMIDKNIEYDISYEEYKKLMKRKEKLMYLYELYIHPDMALVKNYDTKEIEYKIDID